MSERGALTLWRVHREGRVGVRTQKERNEQGAFTFWRVHREGKVRLQKESEQVSSTHPLKSVLGKTSEDTEGERASEGHILPE